SGGLTVLQSVYPNSWLRSASLSLGGMPCLAGKTWQWQGLQFKVLWPLKLVEHAENKDSCVILLTDGYHRILFTGDLEKAQEYELVRLLRYELPATILQVPHHGSNTSSSSLFLRTVQPQLAISSNSRFNRWHLPADRV